MSLNIILASQHGIIVAADRRCGSFIHPILADPEKFKNFPEGMLHFDDTKKIYFYEPPHNFVAFAYSGDGSIRCHNLIKNIEKLLTNEKGEVYDYAEALSQLYERNPPNYKYGQEEFVQGESNNIYVVGYNEGAPEVLAYHVNLPFKPNPVLLFKDFGGILVSGTGDHLEKAKVIFISEAIKEIKNKLRGFQIIGSPVPPMLREKLSILQSGDFPLRFMDKQEMIKIAEFLINFTVSEQTRLNEIPTVGGGIDMLYLTRNNGVEAINYQDFMEVGQRQLAETHYNYVSLVCCETETKIQIDFAEGNPLGSLHIRYPADEIFSCPKCDAKHQLVELRHFVEDLVKKESMIYANH
jgi:hypothetical protein